MTHHVRKTTRVARPNHQSRPRRFSGGAAHRRIYLSLRRDIVDGVIMPGASLPSTRRLAADLRVSRGTVVTAYEQLRGEGYLDANLGGGTRVAGSVPDLCLRAANEPIQIFGGRRRRPSRRGREIADDWRSCHSSSCRRDRAAFRSAPPAHRRHRSPDRLSPAGSGGGRRREISHTVSRWDTCRSVV